LYATKPEHITHSLQMAITVAEEFRELKELGLLPKLEDMTCYEFECYKSAERAVGKVQNDKSREMEEQSKNGPTKTGRGVGDNSAIKW
jgi:hypothetical protein